MSFFNNLFPKKQSLSQEQLQLQVLLKNLSLDELEKIAKQYISRDPKIEYKDTDGIIKTRKANRTELVKSILTNVSLEGALSVIPKLKGKV